MDTPVEQTLEKRYYDVMKTFDVLAHTLQRILNDFKTDEITDAIIAKTMINIAQLEELWKKNIVDCRKIADELKKIDMFDYEEYEVLENAFTNYLDVVKHMIELNVEEKKLKDAIQDLN